MKEQVFFLTRPGFKKRENRVACNKLLRHVRACATSSANVMARRGRGVSIVEQEARDFPAMLDEILANRESFEAWVGGCLVM